MTLAPRRRRNADEARFPSISSWMHTDVKGWTLAERLDDEQYARLLREAERELRRFAAADGSVAFDLPAHVVTATKPAAPRGPGS
ncbi:MAG: hypothetical protein ACREQQ_04980 [Candidatus Binatia bacterium]